MINLDNANKVTIAFGVGAIVALVCGKIILGVALGVATWFLYKKNS